LPPYRQKARLNSFQKNLLEKLEEAPESQCPACKALYVLDVDNGKVWPLSCRRWRCEVCGPSRAALVAQLIDHGLEIAQAAGERCTHLTITDEQQLDLDELMARWKRLRQRLQRRRVVTQ